MFFASENVKNVLKYEVNWTLVNKVKVSNLHVNVQEEKCSSVFG